MPPGQSSVSASPDQDVYGTPAGPGVGRRESRYPSRALRPAGACGPSCPSGCIRDLPSRACQHQATLSGPRVTCCWLHWPGPSSDTLEGCLRADPRCRSHDPKVFCVEQIGRTSEPSGARAVTRVQGPAPGLPVSPGFAPHHAPSPRVIRVPIRVRGLGRCRPGPRAWCSDSDRVFE